MEYRPDTDRASKYQNRSDGFESCVLAFLLILLHVEINDWLAVSSGIDFYSVGINRARAKITPLYATATKQ